MILDQNVELGSEVSPVNGTQCSSLDFNNDILEYNLENNRTNPNVGGPIADSICSLLSGN